MVLELTYHKPYDTRQNGYDTHHADHDAGGFASEEVDPAVDFTQAVSGAAYIAEDPFGVVNGGQQHHHAESDDDKPEVVRVLGKECL